MRYVGRIPPSESNRRGGIRVLSAKDDAQVALPSPNRRLVGFACLLLALRRRSTMRAVRPIIQAAGSGLGERGGAGA